MITLRQYYLYFAIWLPIVVLFMLTGLFVFFYFPNKDFTYYLLAIVLQYIALPYLLFAFLVLLYAKNFDAYRFEKFAMKMPFLFVPFYSFFLAFIIANDDQTLSIFPLFAFILVLIFGGAAIFLTSYICVFLAYDLGGFLSKIGFIKPEPEVAGA